MCTAISFLGSDFYFGRTLDYEFSYEEKVTITPRRFPFSYRFLPPSHQHYAMIGTAFLQQGYPLYYDASNEKGLSMAGLNFPQSACYFDEKPGFDNVATFEFIPWVLSQCASVAEAKALVKKTNLLNVSFSPDLPVSPLHWLIADRQGSIVVESVEGGLHVYDDPVGVMTNEPPFPYQMLNLANFMNISTKPAVNHFAPGLDLRSYSRGMGGMGLPGDLSSTSRFVRAAFTRLNSVCDRGCEDSCVHQFFHILGSVDQQRGCVEVEPGKYEVTIYTSCCNADKGIYYYTTYDNSQITAVHMHHVDLDSQTLTAYPLLREPHILSQN